MTTRRRAIARGIVAGLIAFVTGPLLTWILAGGRAGRLFVSGPLGGAVPDWKAILWVYHDSHFVGTRTPRVIGPGGEPMIDGGVVDTVSLLGVEFLYLVPPVVLVVAGAAVAWRAGGTGVWAGLRAGSTVAVGYVVLAVLTMLLAQQTGTGPAPIRAVIVAGIVYPVVFGATGGILKAVLDRRTDDRTPDGALR